MINKMLLKCTGVWLKRVLYSRVRCEAVYHLSSDRTASSFFHMSEVVDYELRLSIVAARYVRWNDSEDFDISSFVADLGLCCMDRQWDICWLLLFLSTWLEQENFEVRL